MKSLYEEIEDCLLQNKIQFDKIVISDRGNAFVVFARPCFKEKVTLCIEVKLKKQVRPTKSVDMIVVENINIPFNEDKYKKWDKQYVYHAPKLKLETAKPWQ